MPKPSVRGLTAAVWLLGPLPALCQTSAPASNVDLLKHARRVADTDDWHGARFHEDIGVQWLNDHELIHTRSSGEKRERRVAYRLNVLTGRETRLPLLTRALDSFNHEIIDSKALSPDGRWFLWSDRWGNTLVTQTGGPVHYEAANQDAGDNYKQVLWLPDSLHWIENYRTNGTTKWLYLRDVRKPAFAQRLKVGTRAHLLCCLDRIESMRRAIALDSEGRRMGSEPDRHLLDVYALDLTGERATRRFATIHVPRGRDYHAVVSPKCDRLAISLKVRLPNGGYRLEIWTCGIGGRRMRCVGYINQREADPENDPGDFFELQWLPSGKRLAFAWDDVLYTIAAP